MKIVSMLGDRKVAVAERPIPAPGPGQVLIRTELSALCGSEMKDFRLGGDPAGANLGHEAAGTVVQVAGDVDSLTAGARVGVSAIAGCGRCDECRAGRYTWCVNNVFYSSMHAEYFVIPALACHVLPEDVDWATGVLISGDGFGVPFHSLSKFPSAAQNVAVFGLGPVGLGVVLLHSYLGREVIGFDLSPARLELARQFGAKWALQPGNAASVASEVRDLTNGKGADVCVEAAGSPITARACFDSVRKGGTIIFNGEQPAIELSPSEDFIRRDITASGSWFYHFSEFARLLEATRDGLIVSRLATHRFSMEDAGQAFQAMDRGETGKVLLTYA